MKRLTLTAAVALAFSANSAMSAVKADTDKTPAQNSDVMVVTATTHEMSLKDAPASMSIISNEELNRLPATDITTALEYVPGVNISRSTGSEPKVTIRGMHNQNSANGNYALFLVNGRRINSSETVIRGAGFDLSSIPMSAIDHVEVVRGPMSSIYGSDALGGVINIILKQPTEETHVAGSLTYSSPEDRNANHIAPGASGELKKGNVFVSGSLIPQTLLYTASVDISHKDGWYPHNSGSDFNPQAKQQRKAFNTSLTWLASEQDKVLLDLGYSDDDRTELDKADSAKDSYYSAQKYTASLGHIHQWDWGSTELNYFYERTKVHENSSQASVATADMIQNNHIIDGKVVLDSWASNTITSGFQIEYTDIKNHRDYSGDRSVTQNAVYLQDEYALTDSLKATLSGRFTHNNQFGSDFSPRAYLVFDATDNWTFKGGYAEGFKAPTIFQSSNDFSLASCGGGCTLLGNPDLKAQTSKTYELSAMYSVSRGYIQLTGFLNKIKNQIDRNLDPYFDYGADIIYYENISDVETKGFELEGEYALTSSLFLTANATYTRAIDQSDHSNLSHTPRWLANGMVNWSATDDLSLFSGINFTGKQENDHHEGLNPYTTVALGGKYQLTDEVALKAGVTNLFDKRLDRSSQNYDSEIEMGRTYYMTVDFAI